MIIVIGIALFLSVSTIQAADPPNVAIPKILPDYARYVNHTSSKICSSEPICGRVRFSGITETLGDVRLDCVCPEKQQCEYAELSSASPTNHLYKCVSKPPAGAVRPIGWSF